MILGSKVKILTLDTETYDGLRGKLKRIAIYDGYRVYYGYDFDDVAPVIDNYNDAGYSVHVYIHNMEFDLRKIPQIFEKHNVDWKKSLIINNNIVKLKTLSCVYQDSYALLPSSLASLSADFDVEHGKLDLLEAVKQRYPGEYNEHNVVDFLDRCNRDDPLYLEYLGYDVMALYEVIYKLIQLLAIPVNRFVNIFTTASLSRYLFKNGYNGQGTYFRYEFKDPKNRHFAGLTDYQIMVNYDWSKSGKIEEFIRFGYAGGRTELFIPLLKCKPGEHAYYYDVNSLYPYVMSKFAYPVGKPDYYENAYEAEKYFKFYLRHRSDNICGFINCTVYVPPQNIPPLPVKMGKLTFPTGVISGVWTYQELDYAISECGCEILEYHAVCHFALTYKIFERFITFFAKMKEDADKARNKALRTLVKLIMNTGYGYTGMTRDDKYSLDSIYNKDNYKEEEIKFIDSELGFIEIPADIDSEYIQVQIAAYVTSRARLEWLKAAKAAEQDGASVYYGDTDSIVTDKPFDDKVVDPRLLGKWKLERKPTEAIFVKPKVYAMRVLDEDNKIKEKVKFKGVSSDYIRAMDFNYYKDMIKKINQGEKEMLVEEGRTVLRGLMYITKNHLDYGSYETRDKKVYFDRKEKREIDYKHNTSKPLHFNSLDEFMKFDYNISQDVTLTTTNNY